MNTLSSFLKGLTARCVIVGSFCLVVIIIAIALAICLIWRIQPNPDVMANAKELTIALVSALAVFLPPRNPTDAPPGGTTHSTTNIETTTPAEPSKN